MRAISCFSLLSILILGAKAVGAIDIGSKREEVIAELGEPQGEANVKGSKQLFYSGGIIELKDGRVTHIDPNFQKRAKQRTADIQFDAQQRAKGLVKYEGRWISAEEMQQVEEAAKAHKAQMETEQLRKVAATSQGLDLSVADRTREIRENGQAAALATLLTPGQITLVDFYADSSANCKMLLPYLNEILAHNPDVYLCKIDIVNLGTPLARQYNVSQLPFVCVYDASGNMIGRPTGDFEDVLAEIRKTR